LSVRFDFYLTNNYVEFFLKKTETEPKPVQTDRFWFGLIFLEQKPKPNQPVLVMFGSVGLVWFGSIIL
jgi:hypothetical protein